MLFRCPYRQQNYDYVKYLLNVLFYESWVRYNLHITALFMSYYLNDNLILKKTENWESELTEDDWSEYLWDKSKSNQTINSLTKTIDKNQNPTVSSESNDLFLYYTHFFITGS